MTREGGYKSSETRGVVLLWRKKKKQKTSTGGIKSKGLGGVWTSVVSLDVSAAMVVVVVVHVLHRDPAPHTDHKCFNLALVGPASDAEVAVLSPVLSPGVGRDPIFFRCPIKDSLLSPPDDPDRVCAVFAVLWRFGEADVSVFVDPSLVDKEVLMDLHNSLHGAVIHNLLHDLLFVGGEPVGWRGLVDVVLVVVCVGAALRGLTLPPANRTTLHHAAAHLGGRLLRGSVRVTVLRHHASTPEVPPGPVDAAAGAAALVARVTGNKILG